MAQLVRDVMSRKVLFVTPSASIRTAMELLRSQQLDALPVMAGGCLVGMVDALDLYRFNGEFPVTEAMNSERAEVTIPAEASVVDGATTMRRHGLRQLPVVRDGALVGLLSERDLAITWGSVPDERTGLPWQDDMRRWATLQLASGREITVLFLDLNDFGAFNKSHGHVYGDRILQLVAQCCRDAVDPERDHLCRYGGDEFAIASIRAPENARTLAVAIRDAIRDLELEGERVGISAAIGIAGGQRHVPRPGTHPSATLDDLISLASRVSTLAKQTPESILIHETERREASGLEESLLSGKAAPWRGGERVMADGYTISRREREVAVTVGLRRGDTLHEATCVREPEEVDLALAVAAADCLASFAPPQIHLRVEAVRRLTLAGDEALVTVIVAWRDPEGAEERLAGASLARDDAHRAVINAVLDATNRRLAPWLVQDESPSRRGRRRS